MEYALVMAANLAGDGNYLGKKTLRRLGRAFHYHKKSGATLVMAAGFSPDYPQQRSSLAMMMRTRLQQMGVDESALVVLEAETFDSQGELAAFYAFAENRGATSLTVISAPYHLRRIRVLTRRYFGTELVTRTKYVAVPEDRPTWEESLLLEPLKYLKLYLPKNWQTRAVRWARRVGLKQ